MFNMKRKGAESRRERFLRFYEFYCDGLTYQQIADKEGITRERVRQVLHKGATTEVTFATRGWCGITSHPSP